MLHPGYSGVTVAPGNVADITPTISERGSGSLLWERQLRQTSFTLEHRAVVVAKSGDVSARGFGDGMIALSPITLRRLNRDAEVYKLSQVILLIAPDQ